MLCAFKLSCNFFLFTSFIIKTKANKKTISLKFKVITTSKLNNSIVFSLAIFWRPRVDEMGGRELRVNEHKHPLLRNIAQYENYTE